MTTKAMQEDIHVYFEALKVFQKLHLDTVVYQDSRWPKCYRTLGIEFEMEREMYIKYGHQAPSGIIYKNNHSIQFFTQYHDLNGKQYLPISLQRMIEFELGIYS